MILIKLHFEHCVSEIIVVCSMVEVVSLNEQIIVIKFVSNLEHSVITLVQAES